MSLLLLFNDEFQEGDFACGAEVIAMKYVPAGSDIKRKDYTGSDSTAIVPAITVCNQHLERIFDTDKLVTYRKNKREDV